MSGTVSVKFLTPQEKTEKLFQDMEIAIKRFEKHIEKETKGEQRRALSFQFMAVIDQGELSAMKDIVYQSRLRNGGLF